MKDFGLKFIDIMIGVILGLGFNWWPNLKETWQYAAFIFAYLDIVDYWIDYSPSLKKFPPKREVDLILDVAIMFSLFLYIYSAQLAIFNFLAYFILWRAIDLLWLLRAKYQHKLENRDRLFVDTWIAFDAVEITVAASLIFLNYATIFTSLTIIAIFVLARIAIRILASFRYKKVYFA